MSINEINQSSHFSYCCEVAATSLLSGFSGLPLALEHFHALEKDKTEFSCKKLCEYSIAIIECLPLIGGVAMLIEFAALAIFSTNNIYPIKLNPGI